MLDKKAFSYILGSGGRFFGVAGKFGKSAERRRKARSDQTT